MFAEDDPTEHPPHNRLAQGIIHVAHLKSAKSALGHYH